MIRAYFKLLIVFSLFCTSFTYGDTLDYYKIYYNDSLIYESDISHCLIVYSDEDNVRHFQARKPEVVCFNQIDSNDVFRIEYFRDWGGSDDTMMFLELQTDSGRVLKKYDIPGDLRATRSVTMIVEGGQILSALRNRQLNSFVFVYYDSALLEQESLVIQSAQIWGYKYVHEEDWRLKLLKIIIKKI